MAGRVRRAECAPRRRPVRREPEPAADAHPVPGGAQAGPGQPAGAVPGQPRGARHRHRRARRPVRRGQLGEPGDRLLGSRLGGLAGRAGDHPVHLLPAGRRDDAGPGVGGDHLRHRADHDGAAGRLALQGDRLRAGHLVRRGVRPGRVRDEPVLPGRRRRRVAEAALRGVRRRGPPDARRAPAGPGAHPRAALLAHLQRARCPRRGQYDGTREGVRPDAHAGPRGRPAVGGAAYRAGAPAGDRRAAGGGGGADRVPGDQRHPAVAVRDRHRGDAAVGGHQDGRGGQGRADREAGRDPAGPRRRHDVRDPAPGGRLRRGRAVR